jgi:TonB-linked SusC/RagA family outer membrane protein
MKKITFCAALILCTLGMANPFSAIGAEPAGVAAVAPTQQITVRGTVVDENGDPVPGASVVEKGTTNGINTDINGNFVLTVKSGATLEISFVGYTTQEVRAAQTVKVTLSEDAELLEDVVVVGYGTMRKSDLTGSTTSLRSDAITSTLSANPLEALQGKSTGLAVFTNLRPGETPTLRVRGSASINAGNDPLYVVDGFPLVDGDLNDINPADIESMEILKDASATAIYGSRGANGVVMITTKKGAEGRKNISVHASTAVNLRSRLLDTVTGNDFIDYMTKAAAAQGSTNPWPNGYSVTDVNWQEEVISKSSLTQDYGITLDGAAGGTNYMFSAGYYDQEGLIRGTEYEKFSIHNNLQHKFNKWITIGSSMQLTTSTTNKIGSDLSYDMSVTNDIFRWGWPTDPVYNADGSYNIVNHGDWFNPLASIDNQTNNQKSVRFLGNFFLQVDFTEHLNYRINIGYDVKNINRYYWTGNQDAKSIGNAIETGSGSHLWARNRSKLMDNIITYTNEWGDHRMTLTGVYSWQDYKYNTSSMSGSFADMNLQAFDFSGVDQSTLSASSNYYGNRLISWTARGTYNYADKYLLTATIRFDGSSRFGADKKWGTFPSVGIGWRVSNEDFLKDNAAITNLKLRASYGVTGNQEIGNYKSLSKLGTSTGDANYTDGVNALLGYYESVGNSKLKWERTSQLDAGFDLQLYNRFNLTFDFYNRNTNDLLYSVPIPSTSGYSNVLSNVGKVNNHGIEVAADYDIVRTQDWTVNFGVNYTYNTNEIKELYGDVERVVINDGSTTTGIVSALEVGEPVNAVYARHSLGIIKNQAELDQYVAAVPGAAGTAHIGSEMYEDVDGDGQINVNDCKSIGSIEPKHFYGLNLRVQYKDFTFSMYGQGAFKYASIIGAEHSGYRSSSSAGAWRIGMQDTGSYSLWVDNGVRNTLGIPTVDAWEDMFDATTNPGGEHPSPGAKGIYLSDRTNGDWAYFLLKNIQLSYNFGKLMKVKAVKDLTVNVNFQNVAAWANHTGYNPENGDVSNPFARTIMFGINAKF